MKSYQTPKPNRYSTVSLVAATGFSAFLFLVVPIAQLIHFSSQVPPPKASSITQTMLPPPPPPAPPVTKVQKTVSNKPLNDILQAGAAGSDSPKGAKMAIEPLSLPSSVPNPNAIVAVDYTTSFGVNAGSLEAMDISIDIFEIAQVDEIPVPLARISPNIPYALRNREGNVEVIFIVDENGNVVDPEIKSSSDNRFNESVLAAIKRWRFKPGKRGGELVKVRMLQPFKITVQ